MNAPTIIETQADPRDPASTIIEHPGFTDTTATSQQGHFTVFTASRQAIFLRHLQLFGNVRLACRAATVSAQTAYRARRASHGFALAWDAALVAARAHAEATLADRAINGVEEAVYYHGEEIGRRRRYSDRLLLAHLARLDRMEERADIAAALPLLEPAIEALGEGADLDEVLSIKERAPAPAACAGANADAQNNPQDSVPGVPSCRECGGRCDDPSATLTQADCQWLGNRLERMYAARPRGVPLPHEQADGEHDAGDVEWAQLLAFEAGEERWWEAGSALTDPAFADRWA